MVAQTWVKSALAVAAIQACAAAGAPHAPAHTRADLGFVSSGMGGPALHQLRVATCGRSAAAGSLLALRAMSDDSKKDKKDKKKKKDKEKDGDSDGDDDKKEKKKKKKKDKEGESDEEGEKKDGEKKKEKKASKKDKKEKDKDSGNDSWEDDWGEDTTEAAVAEREKMMGGKSQEEEDRLAKKMEDMLKVAEAKDAAGPQKEEKEQEESEDEDDKKAPAPAKEESDDDLDIDDI
mmetsp:Transcript_37019/g.87584  ORF Transcript_37019/g.87584 Transcript_37019/m.87584 type:complete len:234 (+) Transcript_37019:236-937(+)